MDQGLSGETGAIPAARPPLVVDTLPRTIASWGMTSAEIDRLSGAVRYMSLYCPPRRSGLWFLTTDHDAEDDIPPLVWKRITKLQSGSDLPKFSVAVFEGSEAKGRHAHIIFIGTPAIARRLEASQYGKLIDVKRVRNLDGLVRAYLVKTRTPQAQYGRTYAGGRLPGSHHLPGGGDRVRLSAELRQDAIGAGYVEPWQRTNAKRSETRKAYTRRAANIIPFPVRHPPAAIKEAA